MRANLQNRDIRVQTEVESGIGIFKQNRDNSAKIGTVGHSGNMVPPEKKLKFGFFKLLEMHLNCQSYHHHVILYHFKYLQSHQADIFGSWEWGGGGVRAHPANPLPCLRTCYKRSAVVTEDTVLLNIEEDEK